MKHSAATPKIVITNIVSLNTGDAAILRGTIEILRKKYGACTEIVVFDKAACEAQKYYPWATFRQALFHRKTTGWLGEFLARKGYGHWSLRLSYLRFVISVWLLRQRLDILAGCISSQDELTDLREYVAADLILSAGGTYLIENYSLIEAILDYRLSLATGNVLGFFTQTLGPFRQSRNRTAFSKIFARAALIILRDERSRHHVLTMGVRPDIVHMAADAAFVLARFANNQTAETVPRSDASPRVAISVRSMKYFSSEGANEDSIGYLESMALAVQVAVEEFDAKVTFLSTCQGIPEYWTNDADTAEEVCAILPEGLRRHVKVDRQFRQPSEIIDAYQSFDAVIATRMHAAILSICAGTPTLAVAYEFKTEELFKNLGMPELVISVDSLSADSVRTCVRRLLSHRHTYKPRVKESAIKMCTEAWCAESALPVIERHRESQSPR